MTENELAISIAETTPAMLWLGDQDGHCVFLNAALRRFWGVDPEDLGTFDWSSRVHVEDVDLVLQPFQEAMNAQVPFSTEARYRRADGVYRVMKTEAAPRFAGGKFLGMTGVNTDVTEQRDAEEQSLYLMGELNHRTKNLLAVVQAIARSTARTTAPDEFLDTFTGRLSGLAASNDLLVNQDWSAVSLKALVAGQLSNISALEDPRVSIKGSEIQVCAQHAQTLGMALHELATNSLKHGALADESGRLSVTWVSQGPRCWTMEWREIISKRLTPPETRGFGHVVMVDMVEQSLGGQVRMEFPPTGLCWSLSVNG
jgi:PAS domain S-box-containing protein